MKEEKLFKIAVLLTCHNRREKTLSCLENLFKAALPIHTALEVFLVDDGSTDGTASAVKKKFPEAYIIRGSGNLYWTRGMHLAWKTALKAGDFDIFVWLNDDVDLKEHALVELVNTAYETGAVVAGSMQSKSTGKITYGGRDEQARLIEPNDQVQPCEVINGNFVAIPYQIYEDLGNLDPLFPHAIGDFDYALRAKKAGHKIYIAPGFLGFCENHENLPKWCLSSVKLHQRIKHLYSPLGSSHPRYFFIFEKRHFGLARAVKHFLSIHLRVIAPQLWK